MRDFAISGFRFLDLSYRINKVFVSVDTPGKGSWRKDDKLRRTSLFRNYSFIPNTHMIYTGAHGPETGLSADWLDTV